MRLPPDDVSRGQPGNQLGNNMTFDEVLAQIIALLQREGRLAYRALKRRFDLDDEYIEDLKAELIDAKRMATDEDGKVLVWMGSPESGVPSPESKGQSLEPKVQSPESENPST